MFIIFYVQAESELDHHCGGLRSYRHFGTHRSRCPRLQFNRNRAAPLERHVGQPPTTNRTMAHTTGNAREELDWSRPLLSTNGLLFMCKLTFNRVLSLKQQSVIIIYMCRIYEKNIYKNVILYRDKHTQTFCLVDVICVTDSL